MRKTIIFFILFFVCVSLVAAVPPFEGQVGTGTMGLDIRVPLLTILEKNVQYTTHFHVFNQSNGYAYRDGDFLNCTLHIYDIGGHVHIYNNWSTTFHDLFDIEFDLPQTLFDEVGSYSFIVQCETNTTETEGGFVSGVVTITEDGFEHATDDPNQRKTSIVLALIAAIIYFTVFGFFAWNTDMGKPSFWLSAIGFSIGFIELIFLLGIIYLNEKVIFVSNILYVNFISMALVGLGVGLTIIWLVVSKIISLDKDDEKWSGKKW